MFKCSHLLFRSALATVVVLAIFIDWPKFYSLELQNIHVIIVETKKDLEIFQVSYCTPSCPSLGQPQDPTPELQWLASGTAIHPHGHLGLWDSPSLRPLCPSLCTGRREAAGWLGGRAVQACGVSTAPTQPIGHNPTVWLHFQWGGRLRHKVWQCAR